MKRIGAGALVLPGIVLTVAQEPVVNFDLPPGDSNQTVEVGGEANVGLV